VRAALAFLQPIWGARHRHQCGRRLVARPPPTGPDSARWRAPFGWFSGMADFAQKGSGFAGLAPMQGLRQLTHRRRACGMKPQQRGISVLPTGRSGNRGVIL
jgi:hypothetical protein